MACFLHHSTGVSISFQKPKIAGTDLDTRRRKNDCSFSDFQGDPVISYNEAIRLTLGNIDLLGIEQAPLLSSVGRLTAQKIFSKVDSPSLDVSLKDGYAVQSADIDGSLPEQPTRLRVVGEVSAGGSWQGEVHSGEAVKILSGAPVPSGANAVVSQEFTDATEGFVLVNADAYPGRNILRRGGDVMRGQLMSEKGIKLHPTLIGELAAGGISKVPVHRRPRVAVLATGDEVIAPGKSLPTGKLYASNLVTLSAWCVHYGFHVQSHIVADDPVLIRQDLHDLLQKVDVVISSGGAWRGEFDFTVRMLDELGWQKIYHRVRIGPGKAIGFGKFGEKLVFCLPGGPPSNHMAFLQLALPGLQKMAGYPEVGLPRVAARLSESVRGQLGWTQFIHGRLSVNDREIIFEPLKEKSRLQMLAKTDGIIMLPEEMDEIPGSQIVSVQVLNQDSLKTVG